ncbi:dimethyladenosine transferase [secondary endosymbiont of Heteropsylla cubana]|uniref:Ribosomal RNA small subunit methyltransferase A n=1 Tax=secondary endosymbiont of Heteropsylla cubana TaxID=134287 RepID=J3TYJ8_9ENTR|nr:16S rRNA (adenine(1518)-N(6)/adenine(1519)-N(6))-dimethyltransferase RsmA [secondary endosymbiont of Heteropsylla cubana]AFP85450.1 dimethyladenosine transferase [secondary endosymbiont of Heteropsylla cubana]
MTINNLSVCQKRHIARKRFGQHFLHDFFVINNIISAINPQINHAIVEIGPGLGSMTEKIIKYVNKMTVIEIDRDLCNRLIHNPCLSSKLRIIQKDVMKVCFSTLASEEKKSLRIFGNLPYNISTTLIFYLFNYIHIVQDMHFMLQKEVVKRLLAHPNSKSYGRLSIMAQYHAHIIQLIEVSPHSFYPKPKVDSALIRLTPHTKPPFHVHNVEKLAILTKAAFNKRRKTLRNSLNEFFNSRELIHLGIDPTIRAENVSIKDFCILANAL